MFIRLFPGTPRDEFLNIRNILRVTKHIQTGTALIELKKNTESGQALFIDTLVPFGEFAARLDMLTI